MISKLKTILPILILSLAFVLPWQAKASSLEWQERNIELTPSLEGGAGMSPLQVKAEGTPPNEQTLDADVTDPANPGVLTNGSWYWSSYPISAGGKHYYVLKNVPFNSAKYHFGAYEYQPASMNINVYMKFGTVPTTSDYDYLVATGNQMEFMDVEIPKDDEYGDMYLMVYCVSGSGNEKALAWYVSDGNGCWRTADYLSTPKYGDPAIHIASSVDATDTNDFYRVFLYSGQEFKIDGEATSGFTLACYFYDENHVLIASDTSGIWMDITHHITAFKSAYYYVRFKTMGSYNWYISDFSDEKNDNNNRYDVADDLPMWNLTSSGPYSNSMGPTDINDYFYFRADSGQHIQIEITINDPVDSPYYDAFLYSTSYPINDDYVKYDAIGTTLTIDYYCGEYYTSEVHSHGNLVYLRVWNAAAHYGMPDSAAGYTITLTRSYYTSNDHFAGAVDILAYGGNISTPQYGDLNYELDNNDWFKINTKAGYTIKIGVNGSSDVQYPYLDGYLFDDTGSQVASDYDYNITITYTATYTGSYYFRLYEAAAQYYYGPYYGLAEYDWFIYTSAFDGNDNFTTAEYVEPDVTIDSTVSVVDTDDYYQFLVPSGYEISLTGTCTPTNVELYLYNAAEAEVGADINSPWDITYQHKGLETEIYYAHVHNAAGHVAATYHLIITLTKIDPDGEMADASDISMAHGASSTGSDSIGGADINDYYAFFGESGDQFLIKIDGTDDILVRLVQDDGFGGEILLEETVVAGGTAQIEFYPNVFWPGRTFYLRICAPGGNPSGPYDYNVTRVEFDIEDGYVSYSTELAEGQSVTINGNLDEVDTNDWFFIRLRSGERIDIELTSTMPDPHVGFYCSVTGTEADGPILNANHTNYLFLYDYVYIQVVNEAKVAGSYTLEITITVVDADGNGLPETAEELPLDTNSVDDLSVDDINDLYAVEIRSGYNLTVMFNAVGFYGYPIFCILLAEDLTILKLAAGTAGVLTYSNPNFDSTFGYVQFYNLPALITSLNATESLGDYHWNATLVNDDPDGDFDKATTLTGPVETVNDGMFANVTFPTFNISDINDFYKIDLGLGDVLSLSVSITGVSDPWFEVHVYDENFDIIGSAVGADSYDLLINVGAAAGTYYIRFYNTALDEGDYTLALSVYTDTDSYFAGATPVTPGPQTPDSLSDIDLADFYSIHLEPGWRIKVNASVTGAGVHLFAFDPDELSVMADVSGATYLEIEFTAEKSGNYYIEFYNDGGATVDYDWWVAVYEDENGVFATATNIASGDHQDDVQELDKFDYFAFTGNAGEAFTVTATLSAGLDLELSLYDSTEGFIDEDLTGPGLAITYTPSTTDTFYILFANPTGDTGDYSFTLSGAGTAPGPTSPTGPTSPGTNFFMRELLGLPVWLWFVIVGGGLILIIVIIVVVVAVAGKKKKGKVR